MMDKLLYLYGNYISEGIWIEEGALLLMDVV